MRNVKTFALLLLMAVCSMGAKAATIASWNFNKEFDASDVGGAVTYTPNSTDVTVSNQSSSYTLGEYYYAAIQPTFLPNEGAGSLRVVTDNRWSVGAGYNNQCLMWIPLGQTTITDYADASQHDNYCEATLDTRGYGNIHVTLSMTHSRNIVADMHVVYSIDGGTTWVDAYTLSSTPYWWTFANGDVVLPVGNTETVLVRIVRGAGWHETEYNKWQLDYLTITGDAIDPANAKIVYFMPEDVQQSVAVADEEVALNSTHTFPLNRTLYKAGYTLTGWSDGTTTYNLGIEYTLDKNLYELQPIFVANSYGLGDGACTVHWEFQAGQGAPSVQWQNRTGDFLVAQAVIQGQKVDVKLDINTNPGKFANNSWTNWCQVNEGTTFTFPTVEGARVKAYSMNEPKNGSDEKTTLDGSEYSSFASNIATYVVTSDAGSSVMAIKGGSYYRYIEVSYPYYGNYTDFAVDFRNGAVLTSKETSSTTIGIKNDGGNFIRTTADDPQSIATITGQYNDNIHGLRNFTMEVYVPGDVEIVVGTCQYASNQLSITSIDGFNSSFNTNNGTSYNSNPALNVVSAFYTGGKTKLIISGTGSFYMPYIAIRQHRHTRAHGHMNLNTLCFPYQIDSYTGATFYTMLYKAGGTAEEPAEIYLQEHVGALEAGKPYFYVPEGTELVCNYSGEYTAAGNDGNGTYGVYADMTDVTPGMYVTYNNMFTKAGNNVKIREYRAYVNMSEVSSEPQGPSYVPGRKQLRIGNANAPQSMTGIEQITNDQSPITNKVIRNGQLFILRDGKIYNAMGQIVNGK